MGKDDTFGILEKKLAILLSQFIEVTVSSSLHGICNSIEESNFIPLILFMEKNYNIQTDYLMNWFLGIGLNLFSLSWDEAGNLKSFQSVEDN